MRTALLGLLFVSAAACSKGSAGPADHKKQAVHRDASATADADPSKLEGQALYTTFCGHCHGADLKGYKSDNAPSLNNESFLASATDEFISKSIAIGRPGTSMAGYSKDIGGPLDAAAIGRIVTFIRGSGPQAQPLATAASTGDAKRGAPIYLRECQ